MATPAASTPQTSSPALEIREVRLYGALQNHPVYQVRKVGVQGTAGYVASFNRIAKAQAFVKAGVL